MSSDGSPPAISSVVRQTLRKYGDTLKDKLIMQTYDGKSMMPSSISGLQRFFVRTTLFKSMSSKRKELVRKHGIEILQPGGTQWFNHSLTVGVIFENCFAIYS